MITKLFEKPKLTKSDRKKFIPFANERDFIGKLLPNTPKISSSKSTQALHSTNMNIIQNLKKTSKQYFFDKNYRKMLRKMKRIENTMHEKEHNYDEEVDKCFQTLRSTNGFYFKKETERYYVDLKQELNRKINLIKTDLIEKINDRQNLKRDRHQNRQINLSDQFEVKQQKLLRCTSFSKQNWQKDSSKKIHIKKELFQPVGENSKFMTDVTNSGLKYKYFVENTRINPWKKWYVKDEVELFPGEKISIKKLQKSIY